MNSMRLLRTLILCFLGLGAIANAAVFSDRLLSEVISVSQQIRARCRPPECIVIGVGRSPAPFIADLSDQAPGSAFSIPISDFRHNPEAPDHWKYPFRSAPNGVVSLFNQNLDRFLPQAVASGQVRHVVLVDYLENGRSLYAFQRYFERYLSEHGRQVQIDTIGITTPDNHREIAQYSREYKVAMPFLIDLVQDANLERFIYNSHTELFAEYQGNRLYLEKIPEKNPRYEILRREIREYRARVCVEHELSVSKE